MVEHDKKIDRSEPIYSIGEVVKMTGVSKARLNDYDKKGILVPTRAKKDIDQDWRLYSEDDIDRLQKIDVLLAYGLKLKEIESILNGDIDLVEAIDEKVVVLKEQERHLSNLTLFAKFVDLTDSDLYEGLVNGPNQIDEIVDQTFEELVHQENIKQLPSYSEKEQEELFCDLDSIVEDFVALNTEDGIEAFELVIDRFMAWWKGFYKLDEDLGYLEFWSAFENNSTIVEEVERVGGITAAAALEMWVFYVKIRRLMISVETLLKEISEFARKDTLLAMAKVEPYVDIICKALGLDPRNRDSEVYELCIYMTERMRRFWGDAEMRTLLDIDSTLNFKHEDFELCIYILALMTGSPQDYISDAEFASQ